MNEQTDIHTYIQTSQMKIFLGNGKPSIPNLYISIEFSIEFPFTLFIFYISFSVWSMLSMRENAFNAHHVKMLEKKKNKSHNYKTKNHIYISILNTQFKRLSSLFCSIMSMAPQQLLQRTTICFNKKQALQMIPTLQSRTIKSMHEHI